MRQSLIDGQNQITKGAQMFTMYEQGTQIQPNVDIQQCEL